MTIRCTGRRAAADIHVVRRGPVGFFVSEEDMSRHLAAAILIAMGCSVAPRSHAEEPAFPRFDSHVVSEAANATWRNYVLWWNDTTGKPLEETREIPPYLWTDGLRRLEPAYVYAHGVNIVVVRSCVEGNEEGIYVELSISSGPGPDDEQFTRMLIAHAPGGTVDTFRRKGSLERVAAGEKADTEQNECSSEG